MVDFEALRKAIDTSGMKFGYIADTIGITRSALYLRFQNKTEFTASEITKLCEVLRLSMADRERIFFAPMVEFKET